MMNVNIQSQRDVKSMPESEVIVGKSVQNPGFDKVDLDHNKRKENGDVGSPLVSRLCL